MSHIQNQNSLRSFLSKGAVSIFVRPWVWPVELESPLAWVGGLLSEQITVESAAAHRTLERRKNSTRHPEKSFLKPVCDKCIFFKETRRHCQIWCLTYKMKVHCALFFPRGRSRSVLEILTMFNKNIHNFSPELSRYFHFHCQRSSRVVGISHRYPTTHGFGVVAGWSF